jgi:hypothetical protein
LADKLVDQATSAERTSPSQKDQVEEKAAWGAPAKYESPWYPAAAIVAAGLLWVKLPKEFAIGSLSALTWLVPGLEIALLVALTFTRTSDRHRGTPLPRMLSMGLIALINITNLISLIELIRFLVGRQGIDGTTLLGSSADIWATNVIVFALWYWELDRGGPYARHTQRHRQPDFLFPQMATPYCAPGEWAPDFVDYLYVAFTNATAFSPTDTMPLTNWAKLLMMVQSFASLVTVALVAARAVNILH